MNNGLLQGLHSERRAPRVNELIPFGDFQDANALGFVGAVIRQGGPSSTYTLVANELVAQSFPVNTWFSLGWLAMTMSTASTAGRLVRVGMYRDRGDCYPGKLVIDAGQFASNNTTDNFRVFNSIQLPPGLYWPCFVLQGTGATTGAIRAHSTSYNSYVPSSDFAAAGNGNSYVTTLTADVSLPAEWPVPANPRGNSGGRKAIGGRIGIGVQRVLR